MNRILILAPHPDDEILGVGATIAKHIAVGDNVFICIATRGKEPLFKEEGVVELRKETLKAHKILGVTDSFFLDFPATMLEQVQRHEINDRIRTIIQNIKPDTVFIPHFGDIQKDHRIIAEASMVAMRPKYEYEIKEIFAYETLSETEWNIPHSANLFIPNVYNDVSDYIDMKMEALKCYKTQLSVFPNPRSVEGVKALAMYRGSTINVRAAEAFMLIRKIK